MPFELPGPGGGNNRVQLLQSDYAKAIFGALALFLVISLYAIEIHYYFNNILKVRKLVIIGLIVGAVLGILIASRFQKYGEELLRVLLHNSDCQSLSKVWRRTLRSFPDLYHYYNFDHCCDASFHQHDESDIEFPFS